MGRSDPTSNPAVGSSWRTAAASIEPLANVRSLDTSTEMGEPRTIVATDAFATGWFDRSAEAGRSMESVSLP